VGRITLGRKRVRKCKTLLDSLCAKEVMAVHLEKSRCRAVSGAAAALFVVSLSLAGCSVGGPTSACAAGTKTLNGSLGPSTVKGVSNTTLPLSHDNDVGDARILDTTPDADIDANQRPQSCSRPK